ncbi:ABC transporter permease [Alteromonas confluentis]|uniref:Transport permease protein n=1 Tax=Alteromonas confluentis TaxID=1656094 RepID=A0A1E7Z698_9ALTE|nr:ABC transporter permease [Alteromonas confluentis]OFC69030.1 ABC transporter [Alteromonas confluentis]
MELSFKTQLRGWRTVIFALFLREMQSKFNDKLGLGWAFVEPFIFIFAMSFARGFISGSDVHSVPIFVFMMMGLMGVQSFMTCTGSVPNAIKQNKPLYAFRQVQPIAALITSAFMEFSIKCGVIVLIALGIYLLDLDFQLADPLLLIALFLLLWLFSISISLIFAVLIAFVPEINKVKNMLNRPIFFISCTFFSLQDFPESTWHWLTWNPLVHIIELSRYACYPSYGDAGVSVSFIVEVTAVSLFLGLALYHITWKKILAR